MIGWVSWLPQRTTSRLDTIAAFRSSSSSTTPFSFNWSKAISTIPTGTVNDHLSCINDRDAC